jgi:hypothetical protein
LAREVLVGDCAEVTWQATGAGVLDSDSE